MKIFEKIVSIEPSDNEKERIAKALLDSKSLQYRILTAAGSLIRDHDFWRGAQRAFRVRGFRDGNPTAVQKVLTLALDQVRLHGGRVNYSAWHNTWPIYVRSVRAYTRHELSSLYALLTNEDYQPGEGSLTEQVLRAVVKSLPLHEAPLQQVRDLYEIWGFERTELADEILANAYVEADVLRKIIHSSVGTVRREIAAAIATTRSDISRSVDRNSEGVESLRIQIKNFQAELDEAVATLASGALATKSEPPRSTVPHVQANPPRVETTAPVQVRQDHQEVREAIGALRSRVESLGKQLKEIRSRQDAVLPSARPVAQLRSGIQTTTALEVIKKWSPKFVDAGITANSVASAWIILELIRRSRVLITDKPDLFVSLMASLPAAESRRIVASPLWLTDADWRESISFISADDGVPKLLIIEDFDVALQEVYLVPALIGWQASISDQCANRVLLVPADADLRSVSPRVFELATLLTHEAVHIRDLERLASTISDSPPTLEMAHASATVVRYSRTKSVSYEDQLRRQAAYHGVSLPTRLVENFVSLFDGLRVFLKAHDAGHVAMQSILMPWIEHARGETVSRALGEALKRIIDAE